MEYSGEIIDISKRLDSNIGVWPGSRHFHLEMVKTYSVDSIQDSNIQMNLHTGTHVDAPLHAIKDSESVDELPLSKFIGPVRVIDLTGYNVISERVLKSHCSGLGEKRLLFKTDYSEVPEHAFDKNFPALSLDAAKWLVNKNTQLIGIDSPSIQLFNEKENSIHIHLLKNQIAILENLTLKGVEEDIYQLIALPLKIRNAEASPVRAVLLNNK